MDFDHTFLWTATYWYPIEKDRLNVSSQPHSSSRLFCYAGSLSKGSDVGLVYPENMLSEGFTNFKAGLKPDHQREQMNLELHTDGREVAVVGCELNGTGRICFLSGSRAASYRVRELLPIGFASCFLSGLQAADRDYELVDREHELAVMRTEAEVV
ncbi:hypothetical protein DY000_02047679 [Brassica cretica]|uniref:Uncharacterized protein n=1 Tax=Brassica cretica TaxID=69181 RepID=A0ABQ7F343_BRACR|nr:hypothetical protein DY000_02047679 [Brassica cretica]